LSAPRILSRLVLFAAALALIAPVSAAQTAGTIPVYFLQGEQTYDFAEIGMPVKVIARS
jgi:hypothetical protein